MKTLIHLIGRLLPGRRQREEKEIPPTTRVPKYLRDKFPGARTLQDMYNHPNFVAHRTDLMERPKSMSHYDEISR